MKSSAQSRHQRGHAADAIFHHGRPVTPALSHVLENRTCPLHASRSPEELMALFIDHAESHRWAKDPKPSATDSWIGRHGGTETYSDIFALHNTVRNHLRVN